MKALLLVIFVGVGSVPVRADSIDDAVRRGQREIRLRLGNLTETTDLVRGKAKALADARQTLERVDGWVADVNRKIDDLESKLEVAEDSLDELDDQIDDMKEAGMPAEIAVVMRASPERRQEMLRDPKVAMMVMALGTRYPGLSVFVASRDFIRSRLQGIETELRSERTALADLGLSAELAEGDVQSATLALSEARTQTSAQLGLDNREELARRGALMTILEPLERAEHSLDSTGDRARAAGLNAAMLLSRAADLDTKLAGKDFTYQHVQAEANRVIGNTLLGYYVDAQLTKAGLAVCELAKHCKYETTPSGDVVETGTWQDDFSEKKMEEELNRILSKKLPR